MRRNLWCSGINLFSLKGRRFRIGQAIFETTGWCQPCARLERNLGEGTFQAVRGHGGITARVLKSGIIRLDDSLSVEPRSEEHTSELQSLMRISYAVFCLHKKIISINTK